MCLSDSKKINGLAWHFVNGELAPMWYDIHCYKILEVRGFWPFRKLWSPIMFHEWRRGKVYATGYDEPTFNWRNNVEGRSFHSYMNMDDAVRICDVFNENEMKKSNKKARRFYAVFDCVIPADTKFLYEGNYQCFDGESSAPCYASEKLKIGKCVYKNYWESE